MTILTVVMDRQHQNHLPKKKGKSPNGCFLDSINRLMVPGLPIYRFLQHHTTSECFQDSTDYEEEEELVVFLDYAMEVMSSINRSID
jgi:hypothetical protein